MWLVDPVTLKFLEVNQASVRLYGFSLTELAGMTLADLWPRGLPGLRGELRSAMEGRAVAGRWRHRKKGGQTLFVEGTLLRGRAHSQPPGCLGAVLDVTDRVASEDALVVRSLQEGALTELTSKALGLDDPAALSRLALELAARGLGTDLSAMVEPAPGRLVLQAVFGFHKKARLPLRLAAGIRALQDAPVDAKKVPSWTARRPGAPAGSPLCQWVGVPVRGCVPVCFLIAARGADRPFDRNDVRFLRSITEVLATALLRRIERLAHRARVGELLAAGEELQRRTARELHDESGQVLTALLVGLRRIEGLTALTTLRDDAVRLQHLASQLLESIGRLARGLHPRILDDLGLKASIGLRAAEFEESTGVAVRVRLRGLGTGRLSLAVETCLYRLVQEALTNIARHTHARSVGIALKRSGESVELTVSDDGAGFDVEAARQAAASGGRLGLVGLRERIAALGGGLEIRSRPGHGTVLAARLPLPRPAHRGSGRPRTQRREGAE
jgi:PAS domain S-box-containing protein